MRCAPSQSATSSKFAIAEPPAAVISSTTCWAGEGSDPVPSVCPPRSFTTTLAPSAARSRACVPADAPSRPGDDRHAARQFVHGSATSPVNVSVDDRVCTCAAPGAPHVMCYKRTWSGLGICTGSRHEDRPRRNESRRNGSAGGTRMAQATEDGNEAPAFRGDLEGMDDLFDLADPQPKYRDLIDMGGVVVPVEGFTVVASRAAVDEVLRDPATFTSRDIVQLGNVRPLIPLSVDPPEHKKYRRILDPLFAPKKNGRDRGRRRVPGEPLHRRLRRSRLVPLHRRIGRAVPLGGVPRVDGPALGGARHPPPTQGRDHAPRWGRSGSRGGDADPGGDRHGDLRVLRCHPRRASGTSGGGHPDGVPRGRGGR